MTTKEPAPVAILAARIQRAYPSLSAFSSASLATELAAIERAQERHVVRSVNGDYGKMALGEAQAERTVLMQIAVWTQYLLKLTGGKAVDGVLPNIVEPSYEPGGPMLVARFPGEARNGGRLMTPREIAETFVNGNRDAAVQAIAEQPSTLAAALVALATFEQLRAMGGIHQANDLRTAIEARL
jgi:hypothetical protein